jgi:hypothetical protein
LSCAAAGQYIDHWPGLYGLPIALINEEQGVKFIILAKSNMAYQVAEQHNVANKKRGILTD